MKRILLPLFVLCLATPVLAEDAVGDWSGKLVERLRIIVHVKKGPTGALEASVESPDQGSLILAADKVTSDGATLSFAVPSVGGRYEARWDAAQKAWVGSWNQGQSLPLSLTRMDAAALAAMKPKRPQEEAIGSGATGFTESQVSFSSKAAGVTLAGGLSLPKGKGPFPAVVLISGSGPFTRDEDVAGHKVFLVLADALRQRGIAVLRYDKRGTGKSTGTFAQAVLPDFADDAEAALAFLRAVPHVDPRRTGLVGHSEGGITGPIVAARNPAARFVVMLAGPGIKGAPLLARQFELIGKASGMPADKVAAMKATNEKMFAAIIAAKSDEEAIAVAQENVADAVKAGLVPAAIAPKIAEQFSSPYMRSLLAYDPAPILAKLKVPVFALNGSLDMQVPAPENLTGLRAALKGSTRATIVELSGLNHLFQTAKTGAPMEYGLIEETVNPAALKLIGDWVVQQK